LAQSSSGIFLEHGIGVGSNEALAEHYFEGMELEEIPMMQLIMASASRMAVASIKMS
jgi:hypothetical protein